MRTTANIRALDRQRFRPFGDVDDPDDKSGNGDGGDDGDGDDDDLETRLDAAEKDAAKWKAQSRKHEKRAKDNATAADKLKEFEDADKSEIQKLTDRAAESDTKVAEAERRAEKAERDALRLKVGSAKGLTPGQASRLHGEDEDELNADADELIASFTGEDGKPAPPRRPVPKLKGGDDPEDEPEEPDPLKLIEDVPR